MIFERVVVVVSLESIVVVFKGPIVVVEDPIVVLEGIIVVVPYVSMKNHEKIIVNKKNLSRHSIMAVKIEVVYREYTKNMQTDEKIVDVIGGRQEKNCHSFKIYDLRST